MGFTITQIETVTGVSLNLNAAETIIPPYSVWSDSGKRWPAAFLIEPGAAGPVLLKVTVTLQASLSPGDYTLTGRDDAANVQLSGQSTIEAGKTEITFEVKAKSGSPADFTQALNVTWGLAPVATGAPIPYGGAKQPPIELYWLYGKAPILFRKGVPIEILRHAALFLHLSGSIKGALALTHQPQTGPGPGKEAVIEAIIQGCFFINPLIYGEGNTSRFVDDNGGTILFNSLFLYRKYLSLMHHPWWQINEAEKLAADEQKDLEELKDCNCEDQAALVQVYLKAIGIETVRFCRFMNFGKLKLTNLVGRGFTNNPMYRGTETNPVVLANSKSRSGFDLHAFCCVALDNPVQGDPPIKRILDATAGPHIGNETPAQYFSNTREDGLPQVKAGSDIADCFKKGYCYEGLKCFEGVKNLDYIHPIKELSPSQAIENFKEKSGIDDAAAFEKLQQELNKQYVACPWPNPAEGQSPLKSLNWQLRCDELTPGADESLKHWELTKDTKAIGIRLYVSSPVSRQNTYALNRFLVRGAKILINMTPVYPKITKRADLGNSGIFFQSKYRRRYLWINSNIVFEVTAPPHADEAEQLVRFLDDLAKGSTKAMPAEWEEKLPSTIRISPTPTESDGQLSLTLAVGDALTITNDDAQNLEMDFAYKKGYNLELIKCVNNTSLEFKVCERARELSNVLEVMAITSSTLLGAVQTLTIDIAE